MPISREEFESRLDRVAYAALEFLRSRMDEAFTFDEIAEALIEGGEPYGGPRLQQALVELEGRELVETKRRGGKVYYAYRRWLGLQRR